MPSSLARVLSSALDYSSHPPELVAVRSACPILRSFSWQHGLNCSTLRPRTRVSGLKRRICLPLLPTRLHRDPTPGQPILLRPSIARTHRYVNINTFPISYAFQPCLRGRLTLGRLPLPRKPWVYGERVFHPFYRYSCQHNHFSTVQHALRHTAASKPTSWVSLQRHHLNH